MMKGMDESRWQYMAPLTSMTFKGEEEKHRRKLFFIDFVRFEKFKKLRNVVSYGCSTLTIKT